MNKFIVLFLIFFSNNVFCQDPHFSQFFAAPITLSPALTGNSIYDWRFITNYRTQWQSLAAPFNTATLSIDRKFKDKNVVNDKDDNKFGIGANFMYDASFFNIVKSTYATMSLSYKQTLNDENDLHRLGIGFGVTYGNRRISFSELTWEDQFTTGGFNTNLPTGEQTLSNMKPYISLNTGLVYTISNNNKRFEIGGALYHLNKPKQTFLEDKNQVIPMRYVFHSSYEYTFDENNFFININSIYQQQASLNYFTIGGIIGTNFNNDNSSVGIGCFYRNQDAIYPSIAFQNQNWRYNFSYDVTTSKLNQSITKPQSFEISIIYGFNDISSASRRMKCCCLTR